MLKHLTFLLIGLLLFACKNDTKNTEIDVQNQDVAYASFGKEIAANDAIDASSMADYYGNLKAGDSMETKMKGTVKEVCQAKGCWMKVDLENGDEIMVKFKDYGFFVPKNIAGDEVVINGKAFVSEVPVSELRHYAEDAGKSEDEIAAITEPKRTFSFEADGVLVKQQ